jgi:hypothetical protein
MSKVCGTFVGDAACSLCFDLGVFFSPKLVPFLSKLHILIQVVFWIKV